MRKQGQSIVDRRLVFKMGLQKEFIEKIKKGCNKSWRELANILNIHVHTLRVDWCSEETTLPYKKAEELLKLYPFTTWDLILKNHVKKILKPRWGQILAGKKSAKQISYPKNSELLAEFIGITLGDGHVDKKEFTLSGNVDEMQHMVYVKKLINKLFNLDSKIFKSSFSKKCVYLDAYSTKLVEFLASNSMAIGNKINKKARLPKWIFKDKNFAIGAIRGLFDTDGGIYEKQKGYQRAIIEFQTHSLHINKDTIKLLMFLGFKPSKSINLKRGDLNTRIQNQEEVHRFFKIVGSNNLKNVIRYYEFKEKGIVPNQKQVLLLIKKYKDLNLTKIQL